MTTHLVNAQISDSNDETGEETNMSSSEDKTSGEDFSQQLTPKTDSQKEFGRPTDEKEKPEPYVTKN